MPEERPRVERTGREWAGSAQSTALVVIAAVLLLGVLHLGRTVLVPIAAAGVGNIVLKPVVQAFERRGLPRPLGAALLLGALRGAGIAGIATLAEPAADWIERVPQSVRQIEGKLRVVKEPLERVHEATESVERAASVDDGEAPEVRVRPFSGIAATAFEQTRAFLASAASVVVLLYFLLASGDGLLRKVVTLIPELRRKKRVVRIVRSIEEEVSKYLLTITAINIGLGSCVGLAMYALGMPNPTLWGAVSALFNFVPYLGAVVTGTILTGVALLTFDQLSRALFVPLVFAVLTSLEGGFVTPALAGRSLQLSPVAILFSLTDWTWLWGIPGALLSLPVLVVMRVGCSRIPPLRPLAVLISR